MADSTQNDLNLSPSTFPTQKVSDLKKNTSWYKDCVNAGFSLSFWNYNTISSTSVRPSRINKIKNYNFYAGVLDKAQIERVVNPWRISDTDFPNNYKHYPILTQSIKRLSNEEKTRIFNPIPIAISSNVVNEKLEQKRAMIDEFFINKLTSEIQDEKKLQEEVQQFLQYANYNFKDMREKMVEQMLEYGLRVLDIKTIFDRCFDDLLIGGEEIAQVDIVGGEPVIYKVNPINVYTIRSGESPYIEDSDVIVIDGYLSPGEIVNRYYDHLSGSQISDIENGYVLNKGNTNNIIASNELMQPTFNINGLLTNNSEETYFSDRSSTMLYGGYSDSEGNLRVTRTIWRGFRKLLVVEFFDEDGQLVKKYKHETYKPDKQRGETVKPIWVPEWYEGTKIGNDIFVKMQPCEFQARHMDNPAICLPPVFGVVKNVNANRGKSIIDDGANYNYLYDFFMYKLESLWMKSKGKIAQLPLHMIPDGMDINKVMYYAEIMGWLPTDAFNESRIGQSQGLVAGNMNSQSPVIDLSLGNEIGMAVQMLDYCKSKIDDLIGVSQQRRGDIGNRETATGVQNAVSNSAIQTMDWFILHDLFKKRGMKLWIEAAKVAWGGKSIKRQYFLDDGSVAILDMDEEQSSSIAESEYGIDISTSQSDQEMMQILKNSSMQYLQAGGDMSTLMKIYRTKNPASLQREIERIEQQKLQQSQEVQKMQIEQQQAQQQAMLQAEAAKMDLENKKLDIEINKLDRDDLNAQLDRENKIYLEEIRAMGFQKDQDINSNGVPDLLESSKLALEGSKASFEAMMKKKEHDRLEKELSIKERESKDKTSLDKNKLSLERDKIKAAEKLQKIKDENAMKREELKAKTARANKVSGER